MSYRTYFVLIVPLLSMIEHPLHRLPRDGVRLIRFSARPINKQNPCRQVGSMLCDKCGTPHMVEDGTSNVEVYRCWVCGNRMYRNHPRRSGVRACRKCGGTVEETNVLNYCRTCWEGLQIFRKRAPEGLKEPAQQLRQKPVRGSGKTCAEKKKV